MTINIKFLILEETKAKPIGNQMMKEENKAKKAEEMKEWETTQEEAESEGEESYYETESSKKSDLVAIDLNNKLKQKQAEEIKK